ncbi:MAG: agmatine deiminase family protein [Bacteroides sp.]|nr:agmatine deiminase family protein [Bacteroides sp.]
MIHSNRRLPAEWENYEAVIIGWPHADSDWAYMLETVQHTVVEIIETLVADEMTVVLVAPDPAEPKSMLEHIDQRYLKLCKIDTNDTWARDYGVITCIADDNSPVLCDFKFNGWGLKFAADKDNLITLNMIENGYMAGNRENHLGFVLEGGSIESDGKGTILTTSECLLSPNRNGNLSRDEIERYLKSALGAERVMWLDYGYLAGDDTDSHVDTLARLVSDDTIVYVKCDDTADEHYEQLSQMEKQLTELRRSDGMPYNLVGLPMPHPIFDNDGQRLPATYANFLIASRSVLLPVYGQPQNDELARLIMQSLFPDRIVRCIDCTSLIQQHGSLHCMTMQVPRGVIVNSNN